MNRAYWNRDFFICHLLLFSDAFMLDQPEMLFSVGDILSALTNVSGRKHPSTVQAKQLKMCLPMMPVVLHLVTSQVDFFSPKICNRGQTLTVFQNLISVNHGQNEQNRGFVNA